MTAAEAEIGAYAAHLQEQFDDPVQQREAATLGMWIFLSTEILFFGVLFAGYTVMRMLHPAGFAIATVGGLIIAGIVYLATRAMRRPVTTGAQAMIGESAEVLADFSGRGRVRYLGELWNARSQGALHAGEQARIVKVEGLTLWVEPR